MCAQLNGNILCFNTLRHSRFKCFSVLAYVHIIGSIFKLTELCANVSRQILIGGHILFFLLRQSVNLSLKLGYKGFLAHSAKLGHILKIHSCFFGYGQNKRFFCGFNVGDNVIRLYGIVEENIRLFILTCVLVFAFKCGQKVVSVIALKCTNILLIIEVSEFLHKGIVLFIQLCTALGNVRIISTVSIIKLHIEKLTNGISEFNHCQCSF